MKDFHKSVVYQIYPKSFQDTTGSGTGDLQGVIRHLDYLKKLGVDYLWLTPFFVSPQNDNGYDVADYRSIDPRYGTMQDFEELAAAAKERGLGLMLDMVFNHTSTEHEWFQKALAGDMEYRDYYIHRPGKADGSAPTNWISKFGGNAWEYVPAWGEYYLHLFDRTQADLNWENPKVRAELADVLRFWINKGVSGFRFDVVNLISKPDTFEDDFEGDGRRFYTDGPRVHQYLQELCREAGLNENGMVTVGEMSSTTLDNCVRYSNPDEGELSMCFSFHHLKVDYPNQNKWALPGEGFSPLPGLRKVLNTWQTGMEQGGGWNALFWCNHDQPRVVSRFGDDGEEYRVLSAKMLATVIHMMRGTPYIYQGEEIGMTNAGYADISQYRDVESLNYFRILKEEGVGEDQVYEILRQRSRDNSRTPMQWDDSENAGFTTGTPWLAVNQNYPSINTRTDCASSDSIFAYYQKLIALRKEWDVISEGSYIPLLEEHPSVFAYRREYEGTLLTVLCNFTSENTSLPENILPQSSRLLLGNYASFTVSAPLILRPYEALVFVQSVAEKCS